MAKRKHPEDEILDNLYFRQLEKSEQLEQLYALYIQETVQTTLPNVEANGDSILGTEDTTETCSLS